MAIEHRHGVPDPLEWTTALAGSRPLEHGQTGDSRSKHLADDLHEVLRRVDAGPQYLEEGVGAAVREAEWSMVDEPEVVGKERGYASQSRSR